MTTAINPGTPPRTVNTGAKDVPDLQAALTQLESKAANQPWVKKVNGTVVGSFKVFQGVDASDAVLLVQGKGGTLSLWEQSFGIHPGGGAGLFRSTFRQIGKLGQPVVADKDFDKRAKAYGYFGGGKDGPRDTGYNVALLGNTLMVEKPNRAGNHVVLAVTAMS